VSACPKEWPKWLPLAEYWYNTSFHSVLGHTPFEVLYGHKPRHLGLPDPSSVSVQDLSSWFEEKNLLHKLIQQQLQRAQQRMKHQADKNRLKREFQVEDFAYLKLQPHIQSSMPYIDNHKLSFRFFGPYKILARVGVVAYRLELLASA
jgi:hypothetical protein